MLLVQILNFVSVYLATPTTAVDGQTGTVRPKKIPTKKQGAFIEQFSRSDFHRMDLVFRVRTIEMSTKFFISRIMIDRFINCY